MLKYGAAGFSASLLELVLLYALVDYLHLWYLIGSALAFLFGMVVSFIARKFWAFRNKEMGARKLTKQLILYAFVFGGGIILNLWAVYILVEWAEIHYILAQFISVSFVGFAGFAFNKAVTFRAIKRLK